MLGAAEPAGFSVEGPRKCCRAGCVCLCVFGGRWGHEK